MTLHASQPERVGHVHGSRRLRAMLLAAIASGMSGVVMAADQSRSPSRESVVAQAPASGGAQVAPVPPTPSVPAPKAADAPATGEASGGPKFDLRKFDVVGATLIDAARIDAALRSFVGARRDFGDVQKAVETLERLFVEDGFGSVQVLLPEQELEQGTVRINVIEAKIGKVAIEGNKDYSDANIRASLPALVEGKAPNSRDIAANLRLANENPGKGTTVLLRAGSRDDEVDATVKVTEDRVTRWNIGYDNTGAGSTGEYRLSLGFQTANTWGKDHVFAAQVVTSPEERNRYRGYSRDVGILGLLYRMPLYSYGGYLDFTAGYSNVNSGVVSGIYNVTGRGLVYGVKYTRNLRQIGNYDQRVIFGWDWRYYDNNVTPVGGGSQVVPSVTVRPISITYTGTWRDVRSESSFYLGYNRNIPGGMRGGSTAFDSGVNLTSLGAAGLPSPRPGYSIWRYGFSHYRSFAQDWQFRFALTGQETRDKLVPGEWFGIGGPSSVRGLNDRVFANDSGNVINLELYTPDVSKLMKLGGDKRLRFLVFYDYGHLTRNQGNPADSTETQRLTAAGSGFGMRLAVGSSLAVRLDAGFAAWPSMLNPSTQTTVKQFRMHGSVVYNF